MILLWSHRFHVLQVEDFDNEDFDFAIITAGAMIEAGTAHPWALEIWDDDGYRMLDQAELIRLQEAKSIEWERLQAERKPVQPVAWLWIKYPTEGWACIRSFTEIDNARSAAADLAHVMPGGRLVLTATYKRPE